MTLNTHQKNLASKIGHLLALSPLDEDLKKILLANMDKMPEIALVNLLSMLEKEKAELDDISADTRAFLEQQSKNWQELEKNQKEYAKSFIEERVGNL